MRHNTSKYSDLTCSSCHIDQIKASTARFPQFTYPVRSNETIMAEAPHLQAGEYYNIGKVRLLLINLHINIEQLSSHGYTSRVDQHWMDLQT